MNIVPGTVNLDPDGVNAYGSLEAPSDALCPNCCSPYKCNGPHIGLAPETGYEDTQPTSGSVSAPKWSPTPPTKDGWYWCKDDSGTEVVYVAGGWAEGCGDEFRTGEPDSYWHGPLQEPTE